MIIYTTGCAKAGTTLMQMLISTGFKCVTHVRRQDRSKLRESDRGTFSVKCHSRDAGRILERSGKGIRVVWVVRHPYALLLSRSVVTNFKKRHNDAGEVAASFRRLERSRHDERVIVVRFEDLVANPEHVQASLGKALGLTTVRPFSECYDHFDMGDVEAPALKGARPPDRSRLTPWNDQPLPEFEASYLNGALKHHPKLFHEIEWHGYDAHLKHNRIPVVDQHERRRKQGKARATRGGRDDRKRFL